MLVDSLANPELLKRWAVASLLTCISWLPTTAPGAAVAEIALELLVAVSELRPLLSFMAESLALRSDSM